MRVVFMGTPDIAATCLKKLLADGFDVVGVFTQPDRPKGRGMKMVYSPVKEVALAAGLPVFQPENFRGDAPVEQVVVDPSAASFITLIRRHGRFSVRKAKNEVLPGISLVSQYLQAGVLQFTNQCKDTIREFSLYAWEEGRDAPRKENDHAMDDVRYFCSTVLRRKLAIEN